MFDDRSKDTTKLQDHILEQYDFGVTDPNQIAADCDCSASYVRETLNEYREGWDEDGGFGIFLKWSTRSR